VKWGEVFWAGVTIRVRADGLRKSGVALCHRVTTLDRAKLTERLGALPGAALAQVEDGLKIALGME
jgi:mRNA-degrading endonuclease toxin of MazEF toxin-antitoxin module